MKLLVRCRAFHVLALMPLLAAILSLAGGGLVTNGRPSRRGRSSSAEASAEWISGCEVERGMALLGCCEMPARTSWPKRCPPAGQVGAEKNLEKVWHYPCTASLPVQVSSRTAKKYISPTVGTGYSHQKLQLRLRGGATIDNDQFPTLGEAVLVLKEKMAQRTAAGLDELSEDDGNVGGQSGEDAEGHDEDFEEDIEMDGRASSQWLMRTGRGEGAWIDGDYVLLLHRVSDCSGLQFSSKGLGSCIACQQLFSWCSSLSSALLSSKMMADGRLPK